MLDRNKLKNWNLGLAKTPAFAQTEKGQNYNMGHFPAVKSREFSLKSKTNVSMCFGIKLSYLLLWPILLVFSEIKAEDTGLDGSALAKNKAVRPPLLEYELIFQSPVCDHYYTQLRSFIQTERSLLPNEQHLSDEEQLAETGDPVLDFTKLFDQEFPQTAKAKRTFHTTLLTRLRLLLASSPGLDLQQENNQAKFLNQLCYWMYTQPMLIDSYWHFLQAFHTPAPSLKADLAHFPSKIQAYNLQLKKDDQLTGYERAFPPILDPHYNGQLPSVIYRIGQTDFMHLARPLIENKSQRQVDVSPEFKAYLASLKAQGKTHLYVNLMYRQGKESILSKSLEQLEEDEEIGSVITVVTLDKNSPFYWQKGRYKNLSLAEDFKKAFFEHLFRPAKTAVFKWSNKVPIEEWQTTCQQLLTAIHDDYFAGRPTLKKDERQQFVEIFMLKAIENLIEKQHPDYCNISCKHTIDRGPSLLSLFYAYHRLDQNQKWTDTDEKLVFTLLFAPALLSHNRAPHGYRLSRFNLTLKKLMERYRPSN